jgi:hypothetical protein
MVVPPPVVPLSDEELAKDQSPYLLGVFILFTILPILAVGFRLLARRLTSQKLWVDDWLIVASGVSCSSLLTQHAAIEALDIVPR